MPRKFKTAFFSGFFLDQLGTIYSTYVVRSTIRLMNQPLMIWH